MPVDCREEVVHGVTVDIKGAAVVGHIDTAGANLLSIQSHLEPKSAASSAGTDVSSASSSLYTPEDDPGKAALGWMVPSRFRQRSISRSSVASSRTDETPLTPISASDGTFNFSNSPEPSHIEIKIEPPQPTFAVALRPKHTNNRQSWDSALGSDFSGRRVRHAPSGSLSSTSDYSSVRSLSLEPGTPAPVVWAHEVAEPANHVVVGDEETPAVENGELAGEESDSDETVSNDTLPAEDITNRVLAYTLDVALGLRINDTSQVPTACHLLVRNFINDMAWAIDQGVGQRQVPAYDADNLSGYPTNASTTSSAAGSSQRGSNGIDKGKRKSRNAGDDDQDGDDECDDERKRRGEPGPSKRQKLDSAFRMSCPFRKKNPLRFNVRDHRLCALTVFTDTAELRRHIQDWHTRPAPSPYQCLRCQRQFSTKDDFGDHLRSAERCPLIETSMVTYDPEDGIDETIKERLRSKKGRVSDSVEVQWQKIWELLFPDTPVQPYQYCAVMEHFELYEKYCSSLPDLRISLSRIGLGERGLDSLSSILNNHFIDLFEQCTEEGRQKDYRNRQPKPPQSQLRPRRILRDRPAASHRDSGVDVGMDDQGIEGSILAKMDSADSSTPSQGTEGGDARPSQGNHAAEHLEYSEMSGFDSLDPAAFMSSFQQEMPIAFDSGAELGDAGYEGGYGSHPAESPGVHFPTRTGAVSGVLSEQDFQFHGTQENAPQGHWDLQPSVLGFGGPMNDLNEWVYTQHQGQP